MRGSNLSLAVQIGLTLASLNLRSELQHAYEVEPKWPRSLARKLKTAVFWAGWRPGLWAGWCPPMPMRLTWQQHYNAACLYAMPLALEWDALEGERVPTSWDETATELARLAVDHLERAASRADSAFVATRRDWVLEEDADLRGLRHHPEFEAFKANYFPSPDDPAGLIFHNARVRPAEQDTRLVPVSRARESQSQYARTLLLAVSTRWHELWHKRADYQVVVEPHTLARWWQEEVEIWSLYKEVVASRFDWAWRKQLLVRSSELAVNDGLEPVIARYRSLDTTNTPAHFDAAATCNADRFKVLELAFEEDKPLAGHGELLTRWVTLLRKADAEALDVYAQVPLASLCYTHAAIWQTLEECLSAGEIEEDTMIKLLDQRVQNTEALWARVERGVRPSS